MNIGVSHQGRDRASCPVPVLVIAVAAAILVAMAAEEANAQSMRVNTGNRSGTQLWIETTASLEPVTSYDFQGSAGGGPESRSTTTYASLSSPGSFRAGFATPPTGVPITTVRREIGKLWRLRLRDTSSHSYTRVEYDVIGANGERGVLSHTTNDRSMIAVRVVELPVRQDGRPGDLGTVEGGVMLEMDLGRAVEAGSYAGSLRITVVQL